MRDLIGECAKALAVLDDSELNGATARDVAAPILRRALNGEVGPTEATSNPTAEQYERAISRAEKVYRRNKSRAWVLKMLREFINEETISATTNNG